MGFIILGIFLIVYGLFCLFLGITKKPAAVWNMGKIQGFVKLLKEIGTQIFISVFGLAALAGGIILLVYNLPK